MRKLRMFGLALVLAMFGLSSVLARAHGRKYITPKDLAQIKIGQSTQAEVESLLGKPTGSERNGDWIILKYDDFRKGNGLSNLAYVGPVPGLAGALADSAMKHHGENHITYFQVKISIGVDGKVADILTLLDNRAYNADIAKADQIQPGVTTYAQLAPLMGVPPYMTQFEETRRSDLWLLIKCQFEALGVISRQDGTVDWVIEYVQGEIEQFPKVVNAGDLAGIKEQQSTREAAESILGNPRFIARSAQGSFYSYSIYTGTSALPSRLTLYNNPENYEYVYIKYNDAGLVTRLIRKPIKKGIAFAEMGDFVMDILPSNE